MLYVPGCWSYLPPLHPLKPTHLASSVVKRCLKNLSSVDPQDACPLKKSFEFQLDALDNIIKMPGLEEGAKDLIYFIIDLILTSFDKCKNCFTPGQSSHNKKHKLVAVVVKSAIQFA